MLKDNVVSKANDLNLRAYKLSRTEQLLVLSVASMVQPQDEDFKTYKLYIKDFLELLNVSDQSKYIELPKITRGLMTKVIEIKKQHSLLQVAWFSSAEHKHGEGIVEIEFSPKLKPYLLNLKENFVTYALYHVAKLSSKYSIRIYELLKQYQFKKNVTFEMVEFRELIGLDDSIYPRYSNMKPKILLTAQKELKKRTDISFNFEEIKTGKKVTSLKFYIIPIKKERIEILEEHLGRDPMQPDPSVLEKCEKGDNDIKKVLDIMNLHEIEPIEAKKIFDSANGNLEMIERCYKYCCQKKVGSIVAYMIKLVEPNKFIEPKANIPKSTFNNFKQREYDFKDLEKKLLGWNREPDKGVEENIDNKAWLEKMKKKSTENLNE